MLLEAEGAYWSPTKKTEASVEARHGYPSLGMLLCAMITLSIGGNGERWMDGMGRREEKRGKEKREERRVQLDECPLAKEVEGRGQGRRRRGQGRVGSGNNKAKQQEGIKDKRTKEDERLPAIRSLAMGKVRPQPQGWAGPVEVVKKDALFEGGGKKERKSGEEEEKRGEGAKGGMPFLCPRPSPVHRGCVLEEEDGWTERKEDEERPKIGQRGMSVPGYYY